MQLREQRNNRSISSLSNGQQTKLDEQSNKQTYAQRAMGPTGRFRNEL